MSFQSFIYLIIIQIGYFYKKMMIDFYRKSFLEYLDSQNLTKSKSNLYDPINYLLNLEGKRFRPILTLISADCFGGEIKDSLPAALSVELFHNFTLMHDDIMDSAPLRRGKVTVHEKWNINAAILSGDAMLIKSYESLQHYKSELHILLFELLNKTALEVCEGQQLDINFETNENVTLEDYINMIKLKTAVLIACSLKMGSITAGASKIDSQLIYDFGIIIGLAFQIKDDFLDVYGDVKSFGKKIGGDILENKKTILFHKAYSKTSNQNKTLLKKYLSDSYEGNTKTKINIVKKIYTDSGAKSATKNLIKDYLKQAKRKINDISIQNKKKNLLLDFVDNYISF
tara:strand:- start:3033 stop:4061 length:1029 start_codon:yes stop_codon:yes gene_type:complete